MPFWGIITWPLIECSPCARDSSSCWGCRVCNALPVRVPSLLEVTDKSARRFQKQGEKRGIGAERGFLPQSAGMGKPCGGHTAQNRSLRLWRRLDMAGKGINRFRLRKWPKHRSDGAGPVLTALQDTECWIWAAEEACMRAHRQHDIPQHMGVIVLESVGFHVAVVGTASFFHSKLPWSFWARQSYIAMSHSSPWDVSSTEYGTQWGTDFADLWALGLTLTQGLSKTLWQFTFITESRGLALVLSCGHYNLKGLLFY